jgi:hypothetical protein
MAVMKVETDIIAIIAASPIDLTLLCFIIMIHHLITLHAHEYKKLRGKTRKHNNKTQKNPVA